MSHTEASQPLVASAANDEIKESKDHGHSHGHSGHGHSQSSSSAESSAAHGHSHGDEPKNPNEARNKLLKATILCFLFMVAELVGGALASSLAIMTDAAHLLSDMAGFAISIVAISLAKKDANMEYSFGYHRAEILGALASVMLIWALTGVLVYEAILRMTTPKELKVEGMLMFIISCLGILVNGAMMLVLGGHGHSHAGGGHGHDDHDGNDEHTEEKENINVEAAWVHVVGDLIQGIGVMIAAVLIWWGPGMTVCEEYDHDCGHWRQISEAYNFTTGASSAAIGPANHTYSDPEWKWDGQDKGTFKSGINWYLADPVCTLLFSCLVMYTTVGIVKTSIGILMAKAPPEINMKKLYQKFTEIPLAKNVHDLHCWQVSQGKNCMSVHIGVDDLQHLPSVFEQAQAIAAKKKLHACIQIDIGECDEHGHWKEGVAENDSGHGHGHDGGSGHNHNH